MSRRGDAVRKWRKWVLELSAGVYVKSTLHVLIQYADKDGWCWPSKVRIAREAGMSKRKLDQVLQGMERARLIEIARSSGRKTHRYRLTPAAVSDTDETGFNPAHGTWLENPNPARQVPQPCTVRSSTMRTVHPIGYNGFNGSTPRGKITPSPELDPGTELRAVEGSR